MKKTFRTFDRLLLPTWDLSYSKANEIDNQKNIWFGMVKTTDQVENFEQRLNFTMKISKNRVRFRIFTALLRSF